MDLPRYLIRKESIQILSVDLNYCRKMLTNFHGWSACWNLLILISFVNHEVEELGTWEVLVPLEKPITRTLKSMPLLLFRASCKMKERKAPQDYSKRVSSQLTSSLDMTEDLDIEEKESLLKLWRLL